MGTPITFPLSNIVSVSVNIASVAAAPPTFNQGLIVGSSTHIPSVGANARVRQYSSLAGLTADGFLSTDPEFLAAQAYFSPTPTAQFVNIGRQDLTAIAAAIPHSGSAGTGYKVGDVVGVVQGGASAGELVVLTVTSGVPQTLGLIGGAQGTNYAVGTALATTGGSGTGLEVDITAIGESILQAITACRVASPNWYLAFACGASDADALAVAPYAQSVTPQMQFFYNSSTLAVANGVAGNVALALQTLLYNRIYGQYATTQSGGFPNNAYFGAGLMGVAMGLNTGLANSYFTLHCKTVPGMATEPLTQTQVTNIENANFNVYLSYANKYSFEEQSTVSNGQYFDEVLFLDMLASALQYACVNIFAENEVPQDNGGQSMLLNACNTVGQQFRSIGFIEEQGGVWDGPTILNLEAGDAMPLGFLAQSAPMSSPKPAKRAMMPIYFSLIESGSGHSLAIAVTVQR